jgi:hypothetical protein
MPLSKYYGGHGAQVMRSMKSRYGAKKGEAVFYATANKRRRKRKRRRG